MSTHREEKWLRWVGDLTEYGFGVPLADIWRVIGFHGSNRPVMLVKMVGGQEAGEGRWRHRNMQWT